MLQTAGARAWEHRKLVAPAHRAAVLTPTDKTQGEAPSKRGRLHVTRPLHQFLEDNTSKCQMHVHPEPASKNDLHGPASVIWMKNT